MAPVPVPFFLFALLTAFLNLSLGSSLSRLRRRTRMARRADTPAPVDSWDPPRLKRTDWPAGLCFEAEAMVSGCVGGARTAL